MLLVPSPSFAQELKSQKSKMLAKELKETINDAITRIIRYEKEISPEAKIEFNLIQDNEETQSFGLILKKDSTSVILVTPGSNAEKFGIKSGDVIDSFRVNGLDVDLRKPVLFKNGDRIKATLTRGATKVEISDYFQLPQLPAWELTLVDTINISDELSQPKPEYAANSCGHISTYFRPPPSKSIYPASIDRVNEQKLRTEDRIIKVKPGKYTLMIKELIPYRETVHIRRFNKAEKPLQLEITVEPNKDYYIGAKFDMAQRYAKAGSEFWQPVIWKIADKDCEF
ncbi:hypothetical protein GJS41_00795 [Kangiella sp. HZ709]|nr:hypothetical protein [Kangiella sp. HZ709]